MAEYNFDLSKKIKNKTIKLKNQSVDTIIFEHDIAGQVVKSESGNNIVFTVYKTQKIGYSHTKVVEKYEELPNDKYKVTSTKYVYAKTPNNDAWSWQQTGKVTTRTINATEKPISDDKKYWIIYTMSSASSSSGSSSKMNSTKFFSATDETIDDIDGFYKDRVLNKFGTGSTSLTQQVMAKITVKNGNKATSLALVTDNNENYADVLHEAAFAPVRKGNKYTGTFLNEMVTSSSANETFSLKTGNDNINYAFYDGQSKVGNDVINLAKNEVLTLSMLNSTKNTTTTADDDADMYVNTGFAKKGNDLILSFSDEYGASLGKTTIKNYFKVAQDNVTLKYSGASSSVVDYESSLVDLLELEDGIGFLGNEEATKKQTITGNFLDNIIYGGSGKDTIKAVAGDNIIFAGQNSDTVYAGSGDEYIYVRQGDATGNGDTIYNANKDDAIYFLDAEGYIDENIRFVEDTSDPEHIKYATFNFTKKGNNLIVRYRGEGFNGHETADDTEKVTFADYFKNNKDLFITNGTTDYSSLIINQSAKGTVKGTKYNDDITLTKKSKVYTGDGNDTIRFYYSVGDTSINTIVEGDNDTIYINGKGTKVFDRGLGLGDLAGDIGTKTLVFQDKDAVAKLKLMAIPAGSEGEVHPASEGYIYSKVGNNLQIEAYYTEQEGYVYNPENKKNLYDSYGSYVIKDYFTSDKIGDIIVDDTVLDLGNIGFLYQSGTKNKASKFYDTEYNDHFLGANKNDKFEFAYGGKDRAYDIKGDDTYTVKVNTNLAEVKIFDNGKGNDKYNFTNSDLSTFVYINDDGGKKDALNITSLNPDAKISVGVLFNVLNDDYTGPAVESKFMKDDALFLYNKANNLKTSGHIEIGNYFAKDSEGKYSKGAGVIETMKLDGVNIDVSHIDAIRSQVANFLSTEAEGSYASAYQCLMGNNETDIANLISAYTYNQTT